MAARVICFVRRFKWTISTALVFAAVLTWTLWQGDWHRLIWAGAYGAAATVQVAAPNLCRWWGNKRRAAASDGH